MKDLMKITLQELERDGLNADKLSEMDESQRENLILAYDQAAVSRFDKFATIMQTNKPARTGFQNLVLGIA